MMIKIAKLFFSILAIVIFFISCTSKDERKLKISVTTWIGYSPLFYAQEKGWLEPLNIKLLKVGSLAENAYLYEAGNSDAYVGTQFEYNFINSKINSLIPIILFDKSNGGDMIMGNLSLDEIKKYDDIIDIYLEMDSINSILMEDFIKKSNLSNKQFNYINKDQLYISKLNNLNKPALIVTYSPYNITLERNGFKELSSTKNNQDLLVVDALFTTKEKFNDNKDKFLQLKKLIDLSIQNLKNNPKEYYDTVKPYLENNSYNEFLTSLDDISWINRNSSQELNQKLNDSNFPTKDILK